MGLFGSSKSSSTTSKKYITNTDTTTTIRDIGLTGQHAIDLAAIVSGATIEQNRQATKSIDNLMQQAGHSAQQLVGGASDLVGVQKALIAEQVNPSRAWIPWVVGATVGLLVLRPKIIKGII